MHLLTLATAHDRVVVVIAQLLQREKAVGPALAAMMGSAACHQKGISSLVSAGTART